VQTEKDPSIAISKLFERFSPRLPRGHSSLNSRDHKGQLLCRPTQRKQNTAGARTKHPVARATTPALLRISENQIKSNLIEIKLEPRLYQTMCDPFRRELLKRF